MPTASLILLSLLLAAPPSQTDPEKDDDSPYRGGAFLEEDREIAKWVAKAVEYREAGQWSKCVDILQRVIEKGGESMVTSDGRLYRPVRTHCHRLIRQFGNEAIRAYRMAVDVEATRLFEEAKQRRDPAALADVAGRYFCSAVGDNALEMAGDLHVDRREYARALALWDDLFGHYPDDTDVDRAYLAAKMAFAASRLGRDEQAVTYLEEAIRLAEGRPFRIAGETVPDDALRARLLPGVEDHAPPARNEWSTTGGNAAHSREAASIPDGFGLQFKWAERFRDLSPEEKRSREETYYVFPISEFKDVPATTTVVSGDIVVTRDRGSLIAFGLVTGKRMWDPSKHEDRGSMGDASGIGRPWWGGLEYGRASITVTDGKVIVMEGGRSPFRSARWMRGHGPQVRSAGHLAAYDLQTGDLIWKSEEEEGLLIACAPTAWQGRLYAPAEKEGQLFVVALDLESGRTLWKTFVCGSPGNTTVQAGVPVAVDGGLVYALSCSGVVGAVDANDGNLEWAARYSSRPLAPEINRNIWRGRTTVRTFERGWAPSAPIVKDGRLLIAPCDSKFLLCLDALTGELDWREEKDRDSSYLLGATSGLVIEGGKKVVAHDIVTGKRKWESLLREKHNGRGVASGKYVYLPEADRVVRLDADGGKRDHEYPIPPYEGESYSGNLTIVEDFLLTAEKRGIAAFLLVEEGEIEEEEGEEAEGERPEDGTVEEGAEEEEGPRGEE